MILSNRNFDLRKCVPMQKDEEHRCATEYVKTRAPILAERLIVANLRLVVSIAKGYRRGTADLRDLVQEGNLGLIHAVERYDPCRGVKLSSYAAWWIRAYLLKYTLANWRLVKAGTTQSQRHVYFRLQQTQQKLAVNGVDPDVKQLAMALNVKEDDVVGMLERFAGGETSLEAPRSSRDRPARTVGDSLGADASQQPDARVEASEFDLAVRGTLRTFSETLCGRERAIYQRRIACEEPATLAELAADFGVTRERTRQLEQRLKERLRAHLRQELGDALEPHRIAA